MYNNVIKSVPNIYILFKKFKHIILLLLRIMFGLLCIKSPCRAFNAYTDL